MVVFTCGHCGESVQKPKVEKHYLTKCRNRNPNLSCMDCFKDFLGKDYEAHIKCITEEQRYSGKGFVAKEKKGERKQNTWVEMLQSVLEEQINAPKNVLRIIEAISKHNNTPRKKPKFINFVKNVCGPKTNPKDIDQAWDLISTKLSALSIANSPDKNKHLETCNTNDVTDEIQQIEDTKEQKQQNHNVENGDTKLQNGENLENGSAEEHNGDCKKLSKKQRKEEKKRQKYEADLKSAAELQKEELEETRMNKKDKKKKNKINSTNEGTVHETQTEGKKNKKRKRQDTVNSVHDVELQNGTENNENKPANKEKKQKKKLKLVGSEELNETVCLHDQNVAKSEQCEEKLIKNDKFNWHAVILSVLQKKGNELPFKRLQKKVLAEYMEATGLEVDDRIADKFIKKLKSAPNVRVDKNRVLILE